MNFVIVFAAIMAVALAAPKPEPKPDQVVSVSQGSLGDYNIHYATPAQARSEHRNILGEVTGAYSYYDPNGLLRKVAYTADEHGFRVIGNGIPLPVQDTPEVAFAKADHLLRKAEINGFVPHIVEAPAKLVEIPQPLARTYVEKIAVKENPEIAFVNADHLLRKAEVSRIVPEIVEAPVSSSAKLVEISQPLARTFVEKIAVKENPEIAFVNADHLLRKAEVSRFVPEIVETPVASSAKFVEISQPLARTYVEKIAVKENPEVAFVNADHLLRKAEVTRFVPEIVETPAATKFVEISQPFARTSSDKYVQLVRIAPDSPLELESKQFAALVARKNHF